VGVHIIEQRLASCTVHSAEEEMHALCEITGELVLASLGRGDFFSSASLQGGTCLRIFHGLDRFSEDLEFSLFRDDRAFCWARYLSQASSDLSLYGYETDSIEQSGSEEATLRLTLQRGGRAPEAIIIKLTAEANPPAGSQQERRVLDFPFFFRVTARSLPTLFAGTLHALLCRECPRGRDWYDFLWCMARGIPVNYAYLGSALRQEEPYNDMEMPVDRSWLVRALGHKVAETDFKRAAQDVMRFITPSLQNSLQLWEETVFLQQLDKIGPISGATRW